MNWPAPMFFRKRAPKHRAEPCSLDCRDGVPDENCTGSRHLTREEVEFIQSLDSQIGIKP